MSQQTAIDWLVDQIKSVENQKTLSSHDWLQVIEKAKAMEKQQIIKAFCEGYDHDGDNYDGAEISYYNRTYKGGDK